MNVRWFIVLSIIFKSSTVLPLQLSNYHQSLISSNWVKFIGGASNQDVSLIRNLCFLYTAAGVDCIDICADTAVISAAYDGIESAMKGDEIVSRPVLMISVNDDDDPHFRKAYFDKNRCPTDCSRPCEKVCPANAIPSLHDDRFKSVGDGVIMDRCYGCGRCFNVCPLGLIESNSYIVDYNKINDLFKFGLVDGIEIHTHMGNEDKFVTLIKNIDEEVLAKSKVFSVSFPNMFNETASYINQLQKSIISSEYYSKFNGVQIWQTDGKPMSGDTGRGAAHAASKFASGFMSDIKAYKDINTGDVGVVDLNNGKQFVQLAGGTNNYSLHTASENGLYKRRGFGGYAFGGYARKSINQILEKLESNNKESVIHIEDFPNEFKLCMDFANNLVSSVKAMRTELTIQK